MGFARELTDFINAAKAGKAFLGSSDDEAYKKLRNRKLQKELDKKDDPEEEELNKKLKKAKLEESKAYVANTYSSIKKRSAVPAPPELNTFGAGFDGSAPEPGSAAPVVAPAAVAPTLGPQSAIQFGATGPVADASFDTPMQADDEEPTQFAAGGGAIGTTRPPAGRTGRRYVTYNAPAYSASPINLPPASSFYPAPNPAGLNPNASQYAGGAVYNALAQNGSSFPGAVSGAVGALPPASSGGAVAAAMRGYYFADGGVVPDDEGEEATAEDAPDESAVEPSQPMTDVSAQARRPDQTFSAQAAHDAVVDGLTYKPAPRGAVRASRSTSGASPASAQEMAAIRKLVNPRGELSEAQTTMKSLATVYEFHLKNGNEAAAQKAASSLVQYYKGTFNQYSALAKVAAEKGDVDMSARAMLKAYANVPDGQEIKLGPGPNGSLTYSITNSQTGQTTTKGVASPRDVLQWATKIPNFEQLVVQGAGNRAAKPAAAPKPASVRDRASALEAINEAWDAHITERTPVDPKTDKPDETKAPKIPAAEKKTLVGGAFRIFSNPQNSGVTPDEAMGTVTRLVDPDPRNNGAPIKSEKAKDGGYSVRIGDNTPVHIPDADFSSLIAMRVAKKKALEEELAKPKEKTWGETATDAVGGAVNMAGSAWDKISAARNEARKALGAPKELPPPRRDDMPPAQTYE